LDETYFFADIKCVTFYQGCFYILANRLNETIGQYLFYTNEDMTISLEQPHPELTFIIKQENKINIGDSSIDIMLVDREKDEEENDDEFVPGEKTIQIVASFKTCEENTFTVFVA